MKLLFGKLFRWTLQIAAGFVIVLALLVGVLRLLLPEASSFSEDIKAAVSERTGYQLDFQFISAGLSIYGPELRFLETTLQWPDGGEVLAAEKVSLSIDLIALLTSGQLAPGRIYVEGSSIDARISKDGELYIQDRPLSDYLPAENKEFNPEDIPEGRVQLADIAFSFQDIQRNGAKVIGIVNNFELLFDDQRIDVSGELEPGGDLGSWLGFDADLPLQLLLTPQELSSDTAWELWLYADNFRLDPWLRLAELSNIPVIDSEGTAEAQVEFRGLEPVRIETELDLERLQLAQPQGPPTMIDSLEGNLDWRLTGDGWKATGRNLRIGRREQSWPASQFMLTYKKSSQNAVESILLNASFARIHDLMPFAQSVAAKQLADTGIKGAVSGDIDNLALDLRLIDGKPDEFNISLNFSELGYKSAEQELDVSGFSGRLQASQDAGNLQLNSQDARLGMSALFRNVLEIDSLEGLAIWRANNDGYRVLADSFQAETPDGEVQASFELNIDAEMQAPVIDLKGTASLADISSAPRYLPKVLPPTVIDWLEKALLGGRAPSAEITLRGPLKEFPFTEGQGEFVIGVDFEEGVLGYAPGWPLMQQASGRLIFDGVSMYSTENELDLSGVRVQDISMRMVDMRTGVLEFEGVASSRLDELLGFLQQTPVGESLGPVFAEVQATGNADVSLTLNIPVKNLEQWQLDGKLSTVGAEVWLPGLDHFTELSGSARIRNTQVSATAITAKFLDEPVVINVQPESEIGSTYSHKAFISGVMPAGKISSSLGLPYLPWFSGQSAIRATAMFPVPGEGSKPFKVLFESRMEGVSSRIPYPLYKEAADSESMQLELLIPEAGIIELNGAVQRGFNWTLRMLKNESRWKLERGHINSGSERPLMPDEPGVRISGYIDSIDVNDWVSAFTNADPDSPLSTGSRSDENWQTFFSRAELQIGELYAVNHRFVDVDVQVDFNERSWDIYLTGPWAEGLIELPYQFDGAQPAELAMERLFLIEPQQTAAEEESSDYSLDPRNLPGVRGSIDEFALGTLRFGRLELDIQRVSSGLRSSLLTTQSPSFSTEMSTDWSVVGLAQRSRLHVEMISTDMAETLQKLGYSPLISAKSAKVVADLLWEGGPGLGVVYESTGYIDLDVRDGVVNEVDPAGGRILGLLSVTYLPRRLALDFSDMTEDGLVFDRLGGRFRIDFGDAWTCNLGLEGPVADMGIVGRTGMLAEDYDQVAVVRPHVSNLAPVSAAFLAGPAVGAATLLITQIFKKPLSGIGESYYTVAGSWNEPVIDEVSRAKLDTTGFAECETQLPVLSPEEITAIEELRTGKPASPPIELPKQLGPTDLVTP